MRTTIILLLTVLLVACSTDGTVPTPSATDEVSPAESDGSASPEPSPTPEADLTVVSLGDSWPEGAHCGGCRTFAGLYADGLAALTGQTVSFVDLAGDDGTDSTVLAAHVRQNEPTRTAIAEADVVLIATGPNEMMMLEEPLTDGTCGGTDDADCIRALGERWARNFDAIVAEILEIRGDQPTAIRLVNAANVFLSEPSILEAMGQGPEFATGNGALTFELLTRAVCDAAEAHGAQCLDVRPILNGPDQDQPTDENSPENMQAIADALLELGLPEFD
jgi:hypothetical protein